MRAPTGGTPDAASVGVQLPKSRSSLRDRRGHLPQHHRHKSASTIVSSSTNRTGF